MPVTGVSKVNANMKKLVGRIRGEITRKTVTEIMITGQQWAVLLTPVDTSNLINSRFLEVLNSANGNFTGRVGYTAAYAQFVHDGGEKNWQKTGAESEFLRKGFERDGKEDIEQIIKRNYKL